MQARRTTMSAGPGASILAVDARRQAAAAWRLEMLARRVCEQQHELDLQVGVRASRPAVAWLRQGWSQATSVARASSAPPRLGIGRATWTRRRRTADSI